MRVILVLKDVLDMQESVFISQCKICESFESKEQKEPLMSYDIPTRPRGKIGCDLCKFEGTEYLATVDYFSNFVEVEHLSSARGRDVIPKFKSHFARYGTPEEIYSDNGPPFQFKEFEAFTHKDNIDHTTSSPYYPKSSGKAKNAVKTIKSLMIKAKNANSDSYLELFHFRNTPTEGLRDHSFSMYARGGEGGQANAYECVQGGRGVGT